MTADLLHAQGLERWQAGDLPGALDFIGRAVASQPGAAVYRNSLGAVLASMGDPVTGARLFRSALMLTPAEAGSWSNLGHALRGQASEIQVERAYARAAVSDPATRDQLAAFVAETHNDRGIALAERNELAEALAAFDLALKASPFHVEALVNGAYMHQRLGGNEEARRRYSQALVLSPAMAAGHSNLAGLDQGEFDHRSAVRRHRRAVAIEPAPSLHSSLIFSLCCDDATSNDALFGECRRWEDRHARPVYTSIRPLANDLAPDRRLRLGWCSIDLSNHPVGRNVVGLFERLDRGAFTSVIYGDYRMPDPVTSRFQRAAEAWRETKGLSDATVAEQIRADRIDVVVMVAGHTLGNRIGVAAHRPAPLQVSLYDVTTTGLSTMDGWLTDPILHPPATTERFSEQLIRLPCLYLHEPPAGAAELPPSPPRSAPGVTFGSMNNPQKYNATVFAAWARILRAVPNSRLLLKYANAYGSPRLRNLILDAFATHGVSSDRIHFVTGRLAPADHLATLREIDIALDPFPFNGSTTSFEALWMGVPLVTLAGKRFLARVGASSLTHIGLTDLIAENVESYVETAVALAGDPARLAALKQTLRARVAASPLCDPPAHARAFEGALRGMWRDWCRRSAG